MALDNNFTMRVLGGGSLKCGIFLTLLQIDRSKKSQNFNPQESTLIFEKNQKYFLGYPNMCQRPPQESFGQKYFFSFQQSVSFYREPHLTARLYEPFPQLFETGIYPRGEDDEWQKLSRIPRANRQSRSTNISYIIFRKREISSEIFVCRYFLPVILH